jgi:hypothetical protein
MMFFVHFALADLDEKGEVQDFHDCYYYVDVTLPTVWPRPVSSDIYLTEPKR